MDDSDKMRKKLEQMNGETLEYYARREGNLKLLNLLSDFDNYKSLSQTLLGDNEYETFFKRFAQASQISGDDGKAVFDEFYYVLLAKICFPKNLKIHLKSTLINSKKDNNSI